jgi:hypothetical protein
MESTLVTTVQLKNLTSISKNFDVELLQPHLLIAQQLYVQPVLGDALYFNILTKFDTNTISGDTQILLDEYITPAIGFSAWFSAAPFLAYKTTRAGIQTESASDGANIAVTPEELSLYIARVENYKNFYLDRLAKYLNNNVTNFPLFRTEDCQPKVNSNTGQFYLGFRGTRKNNYDGPDRFTGGDNF